MNSYLLNNLIKYYTLSSKDFYKLLESNIIPSTLKAPSNSRTLSVTNFSPIENFYYNDVHPIPEYYLIYSNDSIGSVCISLDTKFTLKRDTVNTATLFLQIPALPLPRDDEKYYLNVISRDILTYDRENKPIMSFFDILDYGKSFIAVDSRLNPNLLTPYRPINL